MRETTPEEIVRNVADSCSIPFVFKNHNSKTNWEFVDGGLFENFPISSIVDHPDKARKTLGFSFDEERVGGASESPVFINYIKLLVSSAIDANIEASLRLLGNENIFRIKTNISTLQFGLGQEQFVNTDSYWDSLKANISIWIEDVVRREVHIDASVASAEKSLIPTTFTAMQNSVGKLFKYRKPDNVIIKKSVSYMQLNSLFPTSSPYRISFDFLYRKSVYDVPSEGIECLFFGTSYSSTIDVEKYSDIVIFDSKGKELEFIVLPISSATDVVDFVCLAIFFSQKIVPDVTSEIVIIQKQYLPSDSLDLERLGHGHFEIRCAPDVRTEQVKLFIGLPVDRSNLYSAIVLDKHHEDPSFDLELIGGTPTNDSGEIIELRSAGVKLVGFELDVPLEPGKAFILKVYKRRQADT